MVFNFLLFRILPGDPVKLIIHSPRMTREAQDRIRASFGLDKPVWFDAERLREGDLLGAFDTQFTAYLRNLLRGDLGISFASRRDVAEILKERVWRTVVLVMGGDMIAIVAGDGPGPDRCLAPGHAPGREHPAVGAVQLGLAHLFPGHHPA